MDSRCESGHVVVCGFGHVGSRIAERLRSQGCEVRVIELTVSDASRRMAEGLGCTLIEGDVSDQPVLESAGVGNARAVLVVTGDDRVNLEAAIASRTINPDAAVVVRLFDRNLGKSIESAFGIRALSSSALAAPAFVAAATDDSIIAALTVDGCRLVFSTDCRQKLDGKSAQVQVHDGKPQFNRHSSDGCAESCLFVSVEPDSQRKRRHRHHRAKRPESRLMSLLNALNPLHMGHTIASVWSGTSSVTRNVLVGLIALGAISVGVFSYAAQMPPVDALYFVVTTMTTVGYGDYNLQRAPAYLKLFGVLVMLSGAGLMATVYAVIADHVLRARMEYMLGRRQMDLSGHAVVVGLGKVGYRVARELCAMDMPVVAIEARDSGDNIEAAREVMPVIIGDASRGTIMRKSAVTNASSILALTDNPMLNLSIALEAKEANPDVKAIIRVWDVGTAEKLKSMGMDEVISAPAIAAPAFADAAMYPGVQGSFRWDDSDFMIVLRRVCEGSTLAGKTADEAGRELGGPVLFSAAETTSDYRSIAPDTVLEAGTKVIVLVAH